MILYSIGRYFSSRWNSSTRTPIIGLPKRKHPPILNSLIILIPFDFSSNNNVWYHAHGFGIGFALDIPLFCRFAKVAIVSNSLRFN
jgi:hypothetical protein